MKPHSPPLDPGVSEFGTELATLVQSSSGAVAAILSDSRGLDIDSAYDPNRIAALDVQLLGAQIGQTLIRLERSSHSQGLGHSVLMLETPSACLVAKLFEMQYILALYLKRPCNLAQAISNFEQLSPRIAALLK